ncbi:site-specific DNA recombinase [Clostridiales Family XIII bacterium PM5-7]
MKISRVQFIPKLLPLVGKEHFSRKVAAYARVSTDSTEQGASLGAQREYFEEYIKAHANWIFVDIYYDSGISGLSHRNRDGFNKMIEDALEGKIDLIITKSLSRFARNTVDTLTTIRKLKTAGIEVFFQKENVYTLDSKGEFLLTLMSSMTQEESRSISENVKWGHRKRFADGRYHVAYKRFLGYDQGGTNCLVVNAEEAKIVKLIYLLYLRGLTERAICDHLISRAIPSPSGLDAWHKNVIFSILANEKYKGDALLQKKFTVDFLSKTLKKNEGEIPQFYVENSHPAIIEPDEWDYVQVEFAHHRAMGNTYSGKSSLSAKLVCEDCGSFFGSKVWHSTDKYRKTIWRCNSKFSNEKRCSTPSIDTDAIKQLFLTAYNQLMQNRNQVVADCELMRRSLTDTTSLDVDIESKIEETQIVAELVKTLVNENASTAWSQDEYHRKYDSLTQRYETASKELEQLEAKRTLLQQRDKAMALFIRTLKKQPLVLEEWNDTIWMFMVEKAVVHHDGAITFIFYNGTEITV